mmetsp:Transcript_26840/g.63679  ORF Transcript_26840/g.63679 Transcript_26840/m.63679 type:complete len:258 (-) Transcript_26840:2167-2940(-)
MCSMVLAGSNNLSSSAMVSSTGLCMLSSTSIAWFSGTNARASSLRAAAFSAVRSDGLFHVSQGTESVPEHGKTALNTKSRIARTFGVNIPGHLRATPDIARSRLSAFWQLEGLQLGRASTKSSNISTCILQLSEKEAMALPANFAAGAGPRQHISDSTGFTLPNTARDSASSLAMVQTQCARILQATVTSSPDSKHMRTSTRDPSKPQSIEGSAAAMSSSRSSAPLRVPTATARPCSCTMLTSPPANPGTSGAARRR